MSQSSLETLLSVVALAVIGAWLWMKFIRFVARISAALWRRRQPRRPDFERPWPPLEDSRTLDALEQLRIVMNADFSARPLLNQSEARVFEELCQIVTRCRPGWRVMAQVSLGEILRSRSAEAFSCVNSKRVDMLLVDENCRPKHAIEYQGAGHYQGAAAARDAVKKEALRRAGIGYHEVLAGKTTPGELRQFVENLISKAETPQ